MDQEFGQGNQETRMNLGDVVQEEVTELGEGLNVQNEEERRVKDETKLTGLCGQREELLTIMGRTQGKKGTDEKMSGVEFSGGDGTPKKKCQIRNQMWGLNSR